MANFDHRTDSCREQRDRDQMVEVQSCVLELVKSDGGCLVSGHSLYGPHRHRSGIGLELRLESIKRLPNPHLDLSKDVDNVPAVFEGYEQDHFYIHIQMLADVIRERHQDMQTIFVSGVGRRIGVVSEAYPRGILGPADREMPMLVWVRNTDEPLRPIDTVIRLQSLERRPVPVVDSVQKSITIPPKNFWPVCNRELSLLLFRAGIKDRESVLSG